MNKNPNIQGCGDCKYKLLHWGDRTGLDPKDKTPYKADCKIGFKSEAENWWAKNGLKRRGEDDFDIMSCFQLPDHLKALDNVIAATDKLLEYVDNKGYAGYSIVRRNLMTEPGYSPYCGNDISRDAVGGCYNPRTKFNGQQFVCPSCKFSTTFPAEFIDEYKRKWGL